jgi:hypothetical protein
MDDREVFAQLKKRFLRMDPFFTGGLKKDSHGKIFGWCSAKVQMRKFIFIERSLNRLV